MSKRTPGPSGGRKSVTVPAAGRKSRAGSSQLIRNSIAWPAQRVQAGRGQRLAACEQQLLAGQVDPGEELGDGVLDLQAGVHLDEVEAAVGVEQELDRAGVAVAAAGARQRRRLGHLRARVAASSAGEGPSSISFWWRRCTEQSRSPSTSTPPSPSASTCISTWRGRDQGLLQVHAAVAERGRRLGRRQAVGVREVGGVGDQAHAAAAAAGDRLQQHRVAELGGDAAGVVGAVQAVGRAGHERHAGRLHRGFGRGSCRPSRRSPRRRADEDQVVVGAGAHEGRALGQEAPAGVDGVAARRLGRGDQVRDVQVALGGLVRADADAPGRPGAPTARRGRRSSTPRPPRCRGRGRRARSARPPRPGWRSGRAAASTETGSSSNSGWPYSTGWAFSTRIRRMTPAWSDLYSLKSFIASRMHSVWPTSTRSPSSTNAGWAGDGER